MIANFYNKIVAAAIMSMAVVAISSCQTPELEPASPQVEFNGVTLNFSSENEAGTKTEWTGKTIVWSAGDAMSMVYSLDGAWNNTVYPSATLEKATAVANFSVPTDIQPDATGEFAFAAVYPSSAITSTLSDSKAVVTVPSNQTPSASTFDKAADIMLGHSVETYTSVPTESVPMLWDRKVAHAYITLTAISLVPGEVIDNVVITANNETMLTGEFEMDLSSGEMSAKKASNAVTVDVSSLSVDSEGKLSFWVSFAPAKVNSLKVELNTSMTTFERVVLNCNIDFLVNTKNDLEIKMSDLPTYPIAIAHRGCWFGDEVPENSLNAVRMAKKFGYKGIELDVKETSDGVLMVLHDQTLNRTMRNAADYSELTEEVALADVTFDNVRANYVMASNNVQMRELLPTLEEILLECKKYDIIPMLHTSAWNAYRKAQEIMGDGNWIGFTNREPSLTFARHNLGTTGLLLYSVTSETADVVSTLESLGQPCGISTMEEGLLTPEYNKSMTDLGYEVQASCFDSPYDWQASTDGVTYHLTNFVVTPDQRMNLVEKVSDFGVTAASGETISKRWPLMEYGATILRIKFAGTLTISVNGMTYEVTSDGEKEEFIGRRFHNITPSFSIAASADTEIEFYEVSVKEPVLLVSGGSEDETPSSTELYVAAEQSKYYMTASEDLNGKITDKTAGMEVIMMDSKFYAVNERILSVSFQTDKPITRVTENGETVSESNAVTMTWASEDLVTRPKVGRSADPGEYGILCLPGSYEGTFTVTTNRYTYQFEKTVDLTAGATTSVTLDFASPLVQPVRKVGILGDSVSTFEGELCNPEYNSWYPGNDPNVTKNPDIAVNSKERTWWWMLLNSHMANGVLDVNSSFSGSRVVSQTRTSNLTQNKVQCGFVDRAYDFVDPDIILIHGGSNDSANSQDLGDYDWDQAVDSSTKHWKFRNAYIQLIKRLLTRYEGVQIIIIIGDALTEEYVSSIIEIADCFGLPYVSFQGVEVDHCSGAHPTYPAFKMMAETIYETCKDYLP